MLVDNEMTPSEPLVQGPQSSWRPFHPFTALQLDVEMTNGKRTQTPMIVDATLYASCLMGF